MSLALLLSTELRVDVEAGFRTVGLSAPGPFVEEVEALGVEHIPIHNFSRSWKPAQDVKAARELWAVLRAAKLDVLHTHTPKAGVLGRILGRLARIPVIVNTCHGLWVRPEDRMVKKSAVYGAEAFAAMFSDIELFQNDEDRQTLRWAMRAGRVRTVGNGVDLDYFHRDDAARRRLREQLGVAPDELLVGGVGRQVAEKGIREFAGAATELHERAHFIWIGPDDPAKPDGLGEQEGVRYLGLRRDMRDLYSAIDVFVLPSYREGFSRSAMEAAACGCALVLSDIRGCREIGRHDEHLLLVPPRNAAALTEALRRLVDDGALRHRLALAAEARARSEFDQRNVARASLAAYRDVALGKGLAISGALSEPLRSL